MTIQDIAYHRKNTLDKFQEFEASYDGNQPDVITALVDKMEHMCFYIGSPSSLPQMLMSISLGKIKRWSTGINELYGSLNKRDPRTKGAQLKGMSLQHIQRLCGEWGYRKNPDGSWGDDVLKDCGYIQGHFRWNFRGYMVDRYTRDYIYNFWFGNHLDMPKRPTNRINNLSHVPTVTRHKDNPSKMTLVVNTKKYRWQYTIDNSKFGLDEFFLTNCGGTEVRSVERMALRDMMKRYKSEARVG